METTLINKTVFKKIEDFNYEIDSNGTIKNLITGKNKKNVLRRDGYMGVQLYTATGKVTNFFVKDLVAKYFLPNPNNWKYINFKDGNRSNSRLSNLEWVEHKNQVVARIKSESDIKRQRNANFFLSEEEIEEIKNRRFVEELSIDRISEIYKISYGKVVSIINN